MVEQYFGGALDIWGNVVDLVQANLLHEGCANAIKKWHMKCYREASQVDKALNVS